MGGNAFGLALRVQGQAEDVHGTLPTVDHAMTITPGYVRVMGIPLRAGRSFTNADLADGPPVALVSESLARRFWPGESAVGKRIGYPWVSPWITIVGVVGDVKLDSLNGNTDQAMYRPFVQSPTAAMMVLARTMRAPASLAGALRHTVNQMDANTPVSDVSTLSQVVGRSIARPRFAMLLFGTFAALALALGLVGIFGVMAYAVRQRTREIGVRLALGASPSHAIRLVIGRAMVLAGVGTAAGLLVALAATRLLAGLLYGISATDTLSFAVVPLLLGAVAVAASWIPARRAARVDPTTALRGE